MKHKPSKHEVKYIPSMQEQQSLTMWKERRLQTNKFAMRERERDCVCVTYGAK